MVYGYGGGCGYPSNGGGYGSNFALIVVLFILLIIVGAAFYC
ncbi:YjcZ family sporulation protein [Virgibacillus salexigens]|nr:YjcZ family sporulation protein [Virgibacillus salexigens]